jgi:hypothetical protein
MNLETITKTIQLTQVSQRLEQFFADDWLNQQAKQTRFIERNRSNLSGRMFLLLNLLELASYPKNSLTDQCLWLEQTFGVLLKKQSLDQRYNTFAVRFLKTCFETLLTQWIQKQHPQHTHQPKTPFERILLRDSTTWQLPATMAPFYPSKDASKTGASIKLDYTVDYLSGQVAQFALEAGRLPDSTLNTQYEPQSRPNDLIIKDVGYWNGSQWKDYTQAGVYFLSRLRSDVSLYQPATASQPPVRIELSQFLPADNQLVSYNWLLGNQKTPVRVCIEKVPDGVKTQRLAKLEKLAKSQKWDLSALRIQFCGYNLYVTNTSETQLASSLIRSIYGLRWQIELVFKAWKSIFDLDTVKPMSIFRFECMLYGRLMLILLTNQLQAVFKSSLVEADDFELSELKAAGVLKKSSVLC